MKLSIQTLIWSCVTLALIVAASLAMLPKPISVEVARASRQPLRLTVREDGKTRVREKYIISAPVAGRLSRIELNSGDPVEVDQTRIAVILPADPSMLDARAKVRAKAQVEQAEAALKRSEANEAAVRVQYDLSKSKLYRLEQLRENQAVSEDEFDEAQADYQSNSHALRTSRFDSEIAAFELEMAKAALLQFQEDSQVSMEPFEVHTPISGKVLRVFQESSTVLSVGTPLIEVGDPSNLEMEIDVLSTDAVKIQAGAEVSIEHWGGDKHLSARVRVVEPAAFTKISSLGVEEQRVNVILDFNELPERIDALGDGYRVEANIVIQELDSALCVPNSALFRYQSNWHVFTIADDRARRTPVEVGLRNESHAQILNGLDEGVQVVLYPSDELSDDSKVSVDSELKG